MAITPENYDVTNPDEVQGQIDPFNHPVPGESLTNEGGLDLMKALQKLTNQKLY